MAAATAILLVSAASLVSAVSNNIAEDAILDTAGLLAKYGYPVERHYVTTQDGYLLGVFRIPSSPNDTADGGGHPVILMHALMSSSDDFVVMGPGDSLAYLLSDANYDVWLLNGRGNKYSRRHSSLSPDDKRFWQFSWHQIGEYDLPATIDYVLKETGRDDVFYIGHSMGTTAFFVMASTRPDYNKKIRLAANMGPIAFLEHMVSPIFQALSFFNPEAEAVLQLLGVSEFDPSSRLLTTAQQIMCSTGLFAADICANIMFLFGGFDAIEMNKTMLPVIIGHVPSGASAMQLFHYGQEVRSGHFRQYDLGLIRNMFKYGSIEPPDYDLSKITCNVSLHYSRNDWCAALVDVDRLYAKLPNCVGRFLVSDYSFSHLDFIWGSDVRELVYDKVMDTMLQMSP